MIIHLMILDKLFIDAITIIIITNEMIKPSQKQSEKK